MSDHLEALEEQLADVALVAAATIRRHQEIAVTVRKAQARVRALRRDGTYRVTWHRGDGELLSCGGLTPELALSRIIGAIANSGPITVTQVEREPCQTTS